MQRIDLDAVPGAPEVRAVLRAFLEAIPAPAQARIESVTLFGSAARNALRADSDIDIYIVWQGREADAYDALSPVAAEVLIQTGRLVSFVIVGSQRHRALAKHPTFFMEDVQRDGILVAA